MRFVLTDLWLSNSFTQLLLFSSVLLFIIGHYTYTYAIHRNIPGPFLAQFTDLFDAVVACAVNFKDVERAAFGDFLDVEIFIVEVYFGTAGGVEAFGKDAGDGGFAGAAGAAEKVSVSDALLLDGVGEGLRDVLLADNVSETLWAIFSGDNLIAHKIEIPG